MKAARKIKYAPKEGPKESEALPEKPKPEGKPRSEKSKNLVEELYTGLVEQSYAASPYVSASQMRPYNPDDLYQKRNDYGIYEEMLQDDQVSICLKIKKDMVLASGWDIICEGDGEESGQDETEIKEYLESALREKPDGGFDDMLEEILSAYEFGFSLTEKVFKKAEDGKLCLKYLRTRHPATWLIHTDDQGIIEKYEQLVEKSNVEIDPKALIHYINQPRFQNPYGLSDLRAAYNAWFVKRQIIKYFAIFLEKAAGPIPVAKYDTNAPQNAVDDIFAAIKSFQVKTALAIPKAIEMDFLESKNSGEAYRSALDIFNMFIGRALFIPDLLGFQGAETGGGSYSLGKDQINVFFRHIQRRRESLEAMVNKHIIRPIVLFNFGEMEKYPKWKLRPIREEDAIEFAKLWLEAVKGKTYKASEEEINHFRKLVKFPEGEVEYIEEQPMQIDPETGKPIPPKPPNMPSKPGDPTAKGETKPEKKEDDGKRAEKYAKRAYDATPGSYSKKVDFKAAETAMDRFRNRILDQAEPVMRRIISDIGEQLGRKRILETQNAEKLETVSPKYLAELKQLLKRNMREAYEDAQLMGERELFKASYRKPLPDEKFMSVIDAELGQYVEDWGFKVTQKVRVEMLSAIRDGRPLSEVLDWLDDDGFEDVRESFERFGRTKFTEVMNRGRLAFFEDSGVVAAYQYSAILDDRTTDICNGLHGKIFKAGDEPIPPLHFNCRSLLVPITRFEEFEVDTKVGSKDIQKFIEDNKGDGFAKR